MITDKKVPSSARANRPKNPETLLFWIATHESSLGTASALLPASYTGGGRMMTSMEVASSVDVLVVDDEE
ncbi:MAG: hypothetical protein JXM71_11470, partial [Spirochaetales bacterium]|nr:hypothetical protein [Spirochaetales bacterium]